VGSAVGGGGPAAMRYPFELFDVHIRLADSQEEAQVNEDEEHPTMYQDCVKGILLV